MIETVAAFSRKLPPSRFKARSGRALGLAVSALGGDAVAVVDVPDGTFVVDARSRTESGMLWNGAYDPDEVAFLRAVLSPSGTFVNVGANVGLIFIQVARTLGLTGRAVAVEPISVNFSRLSAAVDRNTLECTVDLVHAALGAESGTMSLVKEGPTGASGNAVPTEHAARGKRVEVAELTTLDELASDLSLDSVDVLAMDVEGFEIEVLRGADRTLSLHQPLIYGEFNNQLLPLREQSFTDAWKILQPLQYECFSFMAPMALQHRPEPAADLGNVVAVPRHRAPALRAAGVGLFDERGGAWVC